MSMPTARPAASSAPRRHTYASWPMAGGVRQLAAVHPHAPVEPNPPAPVRTPANRCQTTPWTVDDVRERLAEAMLTLRRLPLPPHGFPGRLRSAMPVPLQEALQAEAGPTRVRRPPPTAAQIDRLDRCLEWLTWVEKPEDRMVVSAIALGLHLRKAGRMAGRSHEWARRHEKAALQGIVDRLNRERTG